ncbi:conserved unknown protein [Ectocarpus siliculosus]|uniref:t-SNARE coiled-coil homology domain-containing protein n=1 Tax=Ectocarpus siliculosus TaxID=2880 RepID=D7G3X8_ECTSI|nr:conserved unknown protein [Ectocarpus siliculosus]|eukprot:CBJ27013.1 conserved unknown protein [Ectocarpus siliculosus]
MQQATELNYSIREMHTFLRQHFLDYVDVHHCLPSKRSLMSDEEKDLIDLEVTSFMTACAAGVDALKALLQRERLRRMEQEAAAARAEGADGRGSSLLDEGGVGAGGELRPGSRPAHENAAVTFLFERLKAVTEVAEAMQTERHARAAAGQSRFYGGPADSSGASGGAGDEASRHGGPLAAASAVWGATPEELEEERLLRESLPAAYGDSSPSPPALTPAAEDLAGGLAGFATTAAGVPERSQTPPLAADAADAAAVAETATAGAAKQRPAAAEARRRAGGKRPGGGGVLAETASAVRRRWTGQEEEERGGGGRGSADGGVVSAAVLEGENRDLVARLKNELDDARLVETKMSEISGLMGLFASKVVEQQGGMEHVFDAAVSANDKLVRGGQHLEKAVQRGGGFRLFYAWFMMIASFCLLFLHFFNP